MKRSGRKSWSRNSWSIAAAAPWAAPRKHHLNAPNRHRSHCCRSTVGRAVSTVIPVAVRRHHWRTKRIPMRASPIAVNCWTRAPTAAAPPSDVEHPRNASHRAGAATWTPMTMRRRMRSFCSVPGISLALQPRQHRSTFSKRHLAASSCVAALHATLSCACASSRRSNATRCSAAAVRCTAWRGLRNSSAPSRHSSRITPWWQSSCPSHWTCPVKGIWSNHLLCAMQMTLSHWNRCNCWASWRAFKPRATRPRRRVLEIKGGTTRGRGGFIVLQTGTIGEIEIKLVFFS